MAEEYHNGFMREHSLPSPNPLAQLRPISRQDGRLSRNENREEMAHIPHLAPEEEIETSERIPYVHQPNTFFTELEWDVSKSPRPLLTASAFNPKSSAFIPPLARCKIICKGTPWKFEIKARRQQRHITISSLLTDINTQLLHTVDSDIYRKHRSSEKKDAIMHNHLQRCNRLPTHEERMEALSNWILRVDYLLGKTRFVSFEQSSEGDNVFEMITDSL